MSAVSEFHSCDAAYQKACARNVEHGQLTAVGYSQLGNTNWESNSIVMKICDTKYNKNIISLNVFMIKGNQIKL